MTVAEAKALALALLGFESYDTEPSALLKFVQNGERVVGQILLDANPWIFASPLVISIDTATRSFDLEPSTYSALKSVPCKVLLTGLASKGSTNYQWMPALQPIEVVANSPDAGGYIQPFRNAWAYMPPTLRFNQDIAAAQDLIVYHAELPAVGSDDTDTLFNGNVVAGLYDYLVAYHAAILMGLQRGQDVNGLVALHSTNLKRVEMTVKEMQVQAMAHIPQFRGQAEI